MNLRLRSQVLLILLGAAIAPLAVVGLWLARSAVRSGEELLRSHLDESANRFVAAVATRWAWRQSDLAWIAENEASVRAVTAATVSAGDRDYLGTLAVTVSQTVPTVELLDLHGGVHWLSSPASRAADARARGDASATAATDGRASMRIERPILDSAGRRVGTAVTDIALSALIPPDSARPVVPGSRVGIRNWSTQAIASPLVAAMPFPAADRVTIGSADWLVARRHVAAPTLDVAIGAPLGPYVAPFEHAARMGIAALLIVAALAVVVTFLLTRRATAALEELARASNAVKGGAFGRQVAVAGPAEVRHVGLAFNVMTENLRNTLDALAKRSALAAVGEFATSLSHDVRNALTSIKVDLDRLELRKVADPTAAGLISRAQNSVAQLESSVTGALRVARRGRVPQADIDLRLPIRAAMATVLGTFDGIPATLAADLPDNPVTVRGDAPALQQLFANLLFNAAQALARGGAARITMTLDQSMVDVSIRDDGTGISETDMAKLDTPFFSSKPTGSGLGLPIARQIVAAHAGELVITSVPGRGTTVRVRLPIGTEHSTPRNEPSNELVSIL